MLKVFHIPSDITITSKNLVGSLLMLKCFNHVVNVKNDSEINYIYKIKK